MKFKLITLFVALCIGFTSCSENEKVEVPSTRTVLVYMIESNLGSSLQRNINSMIQGVTAKSLNNGHLVVYYSSTGGNPELFEIKEVNGVTTKHHIKDYDVQSAISPKVMNSVINDVISLYPSESYGLILSSHGMSWLPTQYTQMLRSFGEEDKKSMEIYELAEALPNNRFFDYIIFDACYMGGIECAYELRNKAKYIISSPAEIYSFGFPYQDIIPYLFSDEPKVKEIAEEFYTFYNENESYNNATISVVDTEHLEELAVATHNIIDQVGINPIYSLSTSDIQCYDRFSKHLLFDFDDFIRRVGTDEQYILFAEARDHAIIYKYNTENDFYNRKINHFSGLSTYIPRQVYPTLNNWYTQLEWYKAVYE